MPRPAAFGVYVHVPFCRHRCDYCAFATWTDRSHLMAEYTEAVRRHVAAAVDRGMPVADTVYFGGGTPALLPVDLLLGILAGIPRRPGSEVTVECNPEQATEARFADYRDGGVTRVSLGVQSTVPRVLEALGRRGDPESVPAAAHAAGAARFKDGYSVDVIFGAAGERPADWRTTIADVLALDPRPDHVSAYGLIAEAGTPLGQDPQRQPDPDDQAEKYEAVDAALEAAGYAWYEISNWARPGRECRHNQLYWEQGPYRGFGSAAHSHAVHADGTARRWWNVRTPERYIRRVADGADPEASGEVLGRATRSAEAVELAIRTRDGVAVAQLPSRAPVGFLVGEGLAELSGGRLRLTRRGRLLATDVSLRLAG